MIAGLIKIPFVVGYEVGKFVVEGVGNLFKSKKDKETAKQKKLETKQNALAAALNFLTENKINVKDNTDYKEIQNAIKNFKGGDEANKKKILKDFEVCSSMFKKIDNECIDLKK